MLQQDAAQPRVFTGKFDQKLFDEFDKLRDKVEKRIKIEEKKGLQVDHDLIANCMAIRDTLDAALNEQRSRRDHEAAQAPAFMR